MSEDDQDLKFDQLKLDYLELDQSKLDNSLFDHVNPYQSKCNHIELDNKTHVSESGSFRTVINIYEASAQNEHLKKGSIKSIGKFI